MSYDGWPWHDIDVRDAEIKRLRAVIETVRQHSKPVRLIVEAAEAEHLTS